MNIIIMGCSRVGAQLAVSLDSGGHKVTVLDVEPYAFRFLPATFGGVAMVGSGLEQEALKKAGIEEADVFVSATQGDNRNVMACQIAKHIYHVPKVVSRIYDPIREEMYRKLGLDSVSPTRVVAELLQDKIEG